MVRLSFVIVPALVLAGGMNQVWAQHAGGHGSGGGMSGGHSGFSSGSHSSGGFSGRSAYSSTSLSTQSGVIGIKAGAIPTGGGPYRTGRGNSYGGNRYPGRYPAVYGYYPYFDPFLDYGSGFYNNGPDQNYGYGQTDPGTGNSNVNANLLGEQVDRLSSEVEAMRSERQQQDYAPVPMQRPRYNAPPMMAPDETPSSAPVTLVLRDGKTLKLNSYAVMGEQIWDFTNQPAKKIALASVDLAASQKATEAGGGEFPEIR